MVFLTKDDCTDWCSNHGLSVPVEREPAPNVRVELIPEASMVFSASSRLADAIGPWNTSLLWVVATDIWPSSTNLHLYYRVRQSYHDHRLISQAPGHLFLNYEIADLVTFIQIGICPDGTYTFCRTWDTAGPLCLMTLGRPYGVQTKKTWTESSRVFKKSRCVQKLSERPVAEVKPNAFGFTLAVPSVPLTHTWVLRYSDW